MAGTRWFTGFLTLLLSVGAAQPAPADFGLQEGRPFEGTTLNFLICCETASQFAALAQRTAEEFTPLTGITVNWAGGPFGSFKDKLVVEASSATGNFDLAAWVDAWGPEIEAFLLPLDERLEEAGFDMNDFPAAYREAATLGTDTTYGIPLRGHAFMLFYREDVFAELGLEPPATWQALKEAAQVIEEDGRYEPIAMYYGINAGQNLFNWLSMLWGAGGDLLDDDLRPTFNDETGVAATEFYVSFLREGLTAPGAVAWNEQEANQEMVQGRAAMFTGWSWMYDRLKNPESAEPEVIEHLGFAPAPGWEGGTATSYGHIWPVGILSASRHQDAAWEYLKWLTHPETERAVVLDKSDPETNNIVAVRLSTLEDAEVNATTGGLQATMAEILQTARTQPLIPEWLEIQAVLEIAINEIAGGADVQRTLDDAAADVEDVLSAAGYY